MRYTHGTGMDYILNTQGKLEKYLRETGKNKNEIVKSINKSNFRTKIIPITEI